MAVTRGEIKRLLVNFPPRCSKSNICSVAWPVWTWIQKEKSITSGPQVRFFCGSYGHTLGLKLATKSRRLIESPWFQGRWGDRFRLAGDQNTKMLFENSLGGAREATTPSGGVLGAGGDIIVCFPEWELVLTEFGPRRIGDLVRDRAEIRVWSLDKATRRFALKSIVDWHENPGRPLVRLTTYCGSVTCTLDHKVLTPRGFVEAGKLEVGDFLATSGRVLVPSAHVAFLSQIQIEMGPLAAVSDSGRRCFRKSRSARRFRGR